MNANDTKQFLIMAKPDFEKQDQPDYSENKVKRNLKTLSKSLADAHENTEGTKWLRENFSFLEGILQGIDFRNIFLTKNSARAIASLVENENFEGGREEIFALFQFLEKDAAEEELRSLFAGMVLEIFNQITENAFSDRKKIPHLITLLHTVCQSDFDAVAAGFSPLEKLLRQEDQRVYPNMTRETQLLYQKKIKQNAKKKKIPIETYCKKLLQEAKEKDIALGDLLFPKKKSQFYFPLILLVFCAFLTAFSLKIQNAFLILLLAAPLAFFCKAIIDFIFSLLVRNEPLPQMKIDRISEKEKTLVTITALILSKKDIDTLCRKLHRFQINNSGTDESVYYGLICDFKESKTRIDPGDSELMEYLKESIEKLNREAPLYFAFLRGRSYQIGEKKFCGWERKRGAIEELIAFVCEKKQKDWNLFFGVQNELFGAKYLITLDADTDLSILQAKRLCGYMEHPCNHAKIDFKNGKPYLLSGYGILQPKITTSLMEKIHTRFGKIYSNGSGEIPYVSATFDTYQSLFSCGNFCGKGILDIEAYHILLKGKFPEGKILSHDMPEGAILHAGVLTNEFFSDSAPQNAVSHYKRLHRWIRGDIQNWLLFSKLHGIWRYLLFENTVRYFLPVLELLFIFLSGFVGLREGVICAALVLFLHFEPLLVTTCSMILTGNFEHFNRHFATKMRNLVLNSFYQSVLSVMAIAFESIYFCDAVFRAFFRMFFSKKHLLQWQVYQPRSLQKYPLLFFLPSILLSTFLLFFCRNVLAFLFTVLWLIYPFAVLYLSAPYRKKDAMPVKEKEYLKEAAKDSLRYFLDNVNENTHFLPPDNVQFAPLEKIAMRTSPTNIGLYLDSLLCGVDFGFLNTKELADLLDKSLASIEKLEKYRGNLYNWYDLNTLAGIGEKFVSSVDSGNFLASLILLVQGIKEYEGEEPALKSIRPRVENLIQNTDLSVFYDNEKGLLFVGVLPDEKRNFSHYDLYMSEARITSYLAIALGFVPPSHWKRLSRPLQSFYGRVGVASWSGTAFEYFMPALFLPVIENSLEDESLDFAFHCQSKYQANIGIGEPVFGISESGCALRDSAGNYQYKAFGVPYLSVQNLPSDKKVISPYSSFLMLRKGEKKIWKNLLRLQKMGLRGQYGFFEAIEFNSNFLDDYKIVNSFMAHHTGMSILAIHNAIFSDRNQERFLLYGEIAAKKELLAERFPLEGKIAKKEKPSLAVLPEYHAERAEEEFSEIPGKGFLLTDGNLNFLSFDNGAIRLFTENCEILSPDNGGMDIRIYLGEKEYSFTARDMHEKKILNLPNRLEWLLFDKKISLSLQFLLIPGTNTLETRLEINGFRGKVRAEIGFSVWLVPWQDAVSHPAFQALSLEAAKEERYLTITKRGVEEKQREWIIQSNSEFLFEQNQRSPELKFSKRAMITPEARLIFQGESAGNTRFAALYTVMEKQAVLPDFSMLDGELFPKRESLKKAAGILDHLHRICFYDKDSAVLETQILADLYADNRILLGDEIKPFPRNLLWQYGISGDLPILTFYLKNDETDSLKKYLKVVKKLLIAGFQFDFIIIEKAEIGYFSPLHAKLSEIFQELTCEFLLGKKSGIHFVSLPGYQEISAFRAVSKKGYGFSQPQEEIERGNFRPVIAKKAAFSEKDTVGAMFTNGYVLEKADLETPTVFSHVVANRRIGFVCNQNSLGFTWFRNAGLNRLSRWDNLPEEKDGEKIFLLQNDTLFDLLQSAEKVTFLDHCMQYEGTLTGGSYKVVATVSEELSAKLVFVFLSEKLRENSRLLYSFVPCIGRNTDANLLLKNAENVYALYRLPGGDYPGGGYFTSKEKILSVVLRNKRLEFEVESKAENHFLVGGFSGEKHFAYLKERFLNLDFEEALREEKNRILPYFPLKKLAGVEFWTYAQTLYSRFFAKSGLLQSSGAFGFRDQLQDSLLFLFSNPEITKQHLLRCASHQFAEGDVQHWWHPLKQNGQSDPGIRSLCSDDYLWLVYVLSEYLKATCDDTILEIPAPFLIGEKLTGSHDLYFSPHLGEREPLKEHAKRAVLLFLERGVGSHHLPYFGAGDWNDGMNRIDGESVWLGEFGILVLNRYLEFCDDEDLKRACRERISVLLKGVSAAFNGAWFARGYWGNGEVIGSDISLEKECSIDLIAQAFAAFAFCETEVGADNLLEEQIDSALKSAYEILYDPKNRIVKLFTPPFSESKPSPGYIQKYSAGLRENGGQYTHAAVWYGIALLRFYQKTGKEEYLTMAKEIQQVLDPAPNMERKNFRRYQREPFVLCGDISGAEGAKGRGGWSWYTGAAGWYFRFLQELKKQEEKQLE